MTRAAFLTAYRAELERGGWADWLIRSWITQVNEGLGHTRRMHPPAWWYTNGTRCQAAWTAIGGAGRATLAGLRALPL